MKSRLTRALALTILVSSVVLIPVPAEAAVPIWSITTVNGAPVAAVRGGNAVTVNASCPNQQSLVSGYVEPSAPDDVRRYRETFSQTSYSARVADQSTADGSSITVRAVIKCVPNNHFSGSWVQVNVSASSLDDQDHIAQVAANCPANYRALTASTSFVSSNTDVTVLTSTPTFNQTGWEARGWIESNSNPLELSLNCVPAADMAGAKTYSSLNQVGWGASASVSCASGMVPINGGTIHVGGDGGAITINQRSTSAGWTSTTLSLSTGVMQSMVICLPASNPTVSVSGPTGLTNNPSPTWSFSTTDPAAAGGYTVSHTCTFAHSTGPAEGPTACTSPQTKNDLPDGVHSIQVHATTSDGRTASGFRSITVDTTDPNVVFDDTDGSKLTSSSPTLNFTVSDLHVVDALECWIDAASPTACGALSSGQYNGSQSFQPTGLSEGPHTLHVRATDVATNAGEHNLNFTVDTQAPTVTMTKPSRPFVLSQSATATWWGADPGGTGVENYSVIYRRAPHNADFGAASEPIILDAATTSKAFTDLALGNTYCFSVVAQDQAGNDSSESSKCTAVPLDERSLTRSGDWTRSTKDGWFRTTALSTKTRGDMLSKVASLQRIGLVAQKCPTCGKVGIYVNSDLIDQVSLVSTKTKRALITLPAFDLRTGTVKVKVLSQGKLVRIDALGVSRS